MYMGHARLSQLFVAFCPALSLQLGHQFVIEQLDVAGLEVTADDLDFDDPQLLEGCLDELSPDLGLGVLVGGSAVLTHQELLVQCRLPLVSRADDVGARDACFCRWLRNRLADRPGSYGAANTACDRCLRGQRAILLGSVIWPLVSAAGGPAVGIAFMPGRFHCSRCWSVLRCACSVG